MADLAERKDTKESTEALKATDSAAALPQPAKAPDGYSVPLRAGTPRTPSELLDPAHVAKLRASNTALNLKSNYWFETAGLLRWGTIGILATLTGGIFTAMTKGTALMAVFGGATVGPWVLAGLVVTGLVCGAAMIYASQQSRKIFTEKTFDVQDFQMQRQAALVGKSVERAVDAADGKIDVKPGQSAWSEKFESRGASENWAQAVQADKASQQVASAETVRA